jgi:hypothetical protein
MKRRVEPFVKLQIRIPPALKSDIEHLAEEAGQLISTFVHRILAAHIIKTKATDQTARSGQEGP